MEWLETHWGDIVQAAAYVIAATSIVVKLTPTLKDDNLFLPIIKILSKYVAINTKTPTTRP